MTIKSNRKSRGERTGLTCNNSSWPDLNPDRYGCMACVLNRWASGTPLLMVFLVERNNVCLWWLCAVAPIIYNKPTGVASSHNPHRKRWKNGIKQYWAEHWTLLFFRFPSKNICTLLLKQIDASFSIWFIWCWHDAHHADCYISGNQFDSNKAKQPRLPKFHEMQIMSHSANYRPWCAK